MYFVYRLCSRQLLSSLSIFLLFRSITFIAHRQLAGNIFVVGHHPFYLRLNGLAVSCDNRWDRRGGKIVQRKEVDHLPLEWLKRFLIVVSSAANFWGTQFVRDNWVHSSFDAIFFQVLYVCGCRHSSFVKGNKNKCNMFASPLHYPSYRSRSESILINRYGGC